MKEKFLRECDRFEQACDYPGFLPVRNDIGLKQFHELESKGVRPICPDPYFVRLLEGKKWWEWTVNFIAERYLTRDWDGWWQLAIDFKDDESGYRQIADRVEQREVAMKVFRQCKAQMTTTQSTR